MPPLVAKEEVETYAQVVRQALSAVQSLDCRVGWSIVPLCCDLTDMDERCRGIYCFEVKVKQTRGRSVSVEMERVFVYQHVALCASEMPSRSRDVSIQHVIDRHVRTQHADARRMHDAYLRGKV